LTVNFMQTEALRFSSSEFRTRLVTLWGRLLRISRGRPKCLRLCESLALGERRFVAVVEFEKERFLLGGTPSSLVLLSRLGDSSQRAADDAEEEMGADRRRSAEDAAGEKLAEEKLGKRLKRIPTESGEPC
jgi:flagellar biogenesis protein FliO